MRKKIIKIFLQRLNKDTGEDVMPLYLWNRWYGPNSRFYNKIWNKLDGNNDPYLFDDFCQVGFEINFKKDNTLKELSGSRFSKLYTFSKAMLFHYLLVSFFWNLVGFLIRKIVLPVSTFLSDLWHSEEPLL